MYKSFFKKIILAFLIVFPAIVFGANGTIDPLDEGKKYAKFDLDDSQINFDCVGCNVLVTDSEITGYAWSENFGWVNLNPINSGIQNDGNGNLSGYAFGENIGWVNFNPLNGGVSIDSDGEFTGYAWAENAGWINFDCSDVDSCVFTDWSEDELPVDDGGGGGGVADCGNGLDDDGDNFFDYPDDLGCEGINDNSEIYTSCADILANNFSNQANTHDPLTCTYDPISGCMDNTALNYNPNASIEDGTCLYAGCTNPFATNYNESADFNDGSCIFSTLSGGNGETGGCLDPLALNYNSSSDFDNGSCIYNPLPVFGCKNTEAINFNPNATDDNNSCVFAPVVVGEIPPPSKDGNLINIVKDVSESKFIFPISLLALLVYFLGRSNILVNSFVAPIRLVNVIPSILGFRRKKNPWGTVYDSITKQPLDPVYVQLLLDGKEVATSITDLDGRYGFLVSSGVYKIFAKKDNYSFPSKKLSGKEKDVLYDNLYFGENIEKKEDDDLIIKNIPLDPVNFNWNEFKKSKNKKLMKFFSKTDLFLAKISGGAFFTGSVLSTFAAYFNPSLINLIIFSIYILVISLGIFGVKPTNPGFVLDSKTKSPLSFGIIRVFSKSLNKEMATTVIGITGKYHLLVRNGEYYIKIDKKLSEDKYEEVYVSDPITVKRGVIHRLIKV